MKNKLNLVELRSMSATINQDVKEIEEIIALAQQQANPNHALIEKLNEMNDILRELQRSSRELAILERRASFYIVSK